ncbi:hypothetical protein Ahy_A08g038599 [Arachis hypogaea]|uniref:Uncharacterized protein n=1 Tax=Arachis hypogaea TaxID=3818 RepID=A0A445BU43_ARAHY|nr:hypothetical protein Ahy_A08g038599 [Arachis hypogaea]
MISLPSLARLRPLFRACTNACMKESVFYSFPWRSWAPATTFAHLDATTVISRGLAAKVPLCMQRDAQPLIYLRIIWPSDLGIPEGFEFVDLKCAGIPTSSGYTYFAYNKDHTFWVAGWVVPLLWYNTKRDSHLGTQTWQQYSERSC